MLSFCIDLIFYPELDMQPQHHETKLLYFRYALVPAHLKDNFIPTLHPTICDYWVERKTNRRELSYVRGEIDSSLLGM